MHFSINLFNCNVEMFVGHFDGELKFKGHSIAVMKCDEEYYRPDEVVVKGMSRIYNEGDVEGRDDANITSLFLLSQESRG